MALGGGTYTKQDKVLPGIYVNIISAAVQAGTPSARGIVCVPVILNWGDKNTIISVTAEDFAKHSLKLFGYMPDAPQLLALRELFAGGASKLFAYRVVGANSAVASCTYATAKYHGTRGNALKIVIAVDADDEDAYKVSTYLGTELVDAQVVAAATALKDNDFVSFDTTATLAVTAGTALTGGADGDALTVSDYQAFLTAAEAYSYNVLCCPTATAGVVSLFVAFAKRMRDERGVHMQCVVYKTVSDYEGIINADNAASGYTADNLGVGAYGLTYWIAGAASGCALGKSLTNALYTGELTVDTAYTQAALEACIKAGKFVLHNVGGTVRVLEDINSLTSTTDAKGAAFKYNEVVRAVDALADDIAAKFAGDYMGKIANDAEGRVSLWNDICKIIQSYETAGVFDGFSADMVTVSAGDSANAVVCTIDGLTVAYTMTQLYMSITIA